MTDVWVVDITETRVSQFAVRAKTRKEAKELAVRFLNGFEEPYRVSHDTRVAANRTDYPHLYRITEIEGERP